MGRKSVAVLRGALALASASLAVAMGCTSFSGSDADPEDAAVEGGGDADADADVDAGRTPSDAAAPCVSLIVNAGFEEQQADCRPWINYGGDATGGTPPRSGTNACRACTSAGSAGRINLVVRLIGETFAPGQVVRFEGWMRAYDGKLVASSAVLYARPSDNIEGTIASTERSLTTAYQRITLDLVIPADGGAGQVPSFQFVVSRPTDAGGECILLDDVSACRVIDGG